MGGSGEFSKSCASQQGQRIAFFGGSFDPPHRGHLAIARAALQALDLDTVLFAPVGTQPLKPDGATASFDQRVAMTKLAVADEPHFAVSLADAPSASGGPNYTIDTLLRLKKELRQDSALFCLVGADSFLNLRHWRRGEEIPFIAPLIVASRPGQRFDELAAVLPADVILEEGSIPSSKPNDIELRTYTLHNGAGAAAPFYVLPGLYIDISATAIRDEVRREVARIPPGQGHHCDLPDAIFDYIAEHNLYR